MPRVVIEVGANKGTDTMRFLSDGCIVYAFEPTPELSLELKEKFKGYPNYYPMPLAVDIENGWKQFNIAGTSDWGCSSLFQFNPNIENEWPDRPDFKFTDYCRVPTIRLDSFMTLYGINQVDYIWIDAQGNDYRVLQSLGKKINCVKEGRCESAWSVNLYREVDNTTETIKKFLTKKGFELTVEVDKYYGKYEADIHFKKN